jgi:hypothetical protein
VPVDLEPFIELPGHNCAGHANDTYRFGYRCTQTGIPTAFVEIAASTVAQFVPLQVSARMAIDGKVVVHAQLPDIDHGRLSHQSEPISLMELIEAALDVDNLRREEAGQRELRTLLQALEISVQRVKVALEAM